MSALLAIIAAIAPVAIALWYIFKKDSAQPEPKKWLMIAFAYGVVSVFVSFVFSEPLAFLSGLSTDDESISIGHSFGVAFLLAAIPEELAKYLMFRLLIKRNRFFDEKFDGIVYAVFVSMGFACLENVLYLLQGLSNGSWISVGIGRALFSIPGHFFFAVLMGYYFSLYHFGIDRSKKTLLLILGAPILAHGLFDAFLMSMSVNELYSLVFFAVFLYFFFKLKKYATKRIFELMDK